MAVSNGGRDETRREERREGRKEGRKEGTDRKETK